MTTTTNNNTARPTSGNAAIARSTLCLFTGLLAIALASTQSGCAASGYNAESGASDDRAGAGGIGGANRRPTHAMMRDAEGDGYFGSDSGVMEPQGVANAARPSSERSESTGDGTTRADGPTTGQPDTSRAVVTRRDFPEVMLSEPQLITDENGIAEIEIDRMADSITTWRVDVLAHTTDGVFGQGQGQFRVFKEFFLNLQLPVALTVGDSLRLPLSVFNYTRDRLPVELELVEAAWFTRNDDAPLSVTVDPKSSGKAWLDITVMREGTHILDVTATSGDLVDRVAVPLRVEPPGVVREVVLAHESLRDSFEGTVVFPTDTAASSRRVSVYVFPTTMASLLAGREYLFQIPTGCLEQTLSTAWVDVQLAEAYARLPVEAPGRAAGIERAREVIELAYQRLLGFRDEYGQFASYPGRYRADFDPWLSGYVLRVLKSMQRVIAVDVGLIATLEQNFLASADQIAAAMGDSYSMHRYLYGLWAALEGRTRVPQQVEVLLDALTRQDPNYFDDYALALLLNVYAAARDIESPTLRTRIAERFNYLAVHTASRLGFDVQGRLAIGDNVETLTWARGSAAAQEIVALMLVALTDHGVNLGDESMIDPLMGYLMRTRNSRCGWASTQSTALAMRAIAQVAARDTSRKQEPFTFTAVIDGVARDPITIDPTKNPNVPVRLDYAVAADGAASQVSFATSHNVAMTIIGRAAFERAEPLPSEAYTLAVTPSVASTFAGETFKLHVECARRGNVGPLGDAHAEQIGWWPDQYVAPRDASREMPTVIEIGLPGTCRTIPDALDALVDARRIERYDISGRTVVLYLRGVVERFNCDIPVTAVNPSTAQSAPSRVYEYYTPDGMGTAPAYTLRIAPRE